MAETALPCWWSRLARGSSRTEQPTRLGEVEEDRLQDDEIEEQQVLEEEDRHVEEDHQERQDAPRRAPEEHRQETHLEGHGRQAEQREERVGSLHESQREPPVKVHRVQARAVVDRPDVRGVPPVEAAVAELAQPRRRVGERDDGPAGVP